MADGDMADGDTADGDMTEAETLFHIAEPQRWAKAQQTNEYQADSLAIEGFIHCSTRAQVLATAQRYYAGRTNLVLLELDSGALAVRWERSIGDELFPHVYAAIPIGAVRAVHRFAPDTNGAFVLP